MRVLLRLLVATPLLALIAGTLSVYPHQLAYFNEAAGGPENGHKHLLHSNLDWGQDLLEVRQWASENKWARPFGIFSSTPIGWLSLPDDCKMLGHYGESEGLLDEGYFIVPASGFYHFQSRQTLKTTSREHVRITIVTQIGGTVLLEVRSVPTGATGLLPITFNHHTATRFHIATRLPVVNSWRLMLVDSSTADSNHSSWMRPRPIPHQAATW